MKESPEAAAPLPASPKPGKGPVIGLALGSGSARGWAHIGVIQALEDMGVRPQVVAGTSIGALVGATRATGDALIFSIFGRGIWCCTLCV